jgi:hypothetical protein
MISGIPVHEISYVESATRDDARVLWLAVLEITVPCEAVWLSKEQNCTTEQHKAITKSRIGKNVFMLED